MEPLLRWAGSKRWQVDTIRPWWDAHKRHREAGRDGWPNEHRFVELFAGSAAVAFGLEPERVVLNDVNPHLMNFYQHVRRGMTYDLVTQNVAYYEHREWFNQLVGQGEIHSQMAAKLFYYLNVHGFNNLCRFNRKGEFNVPVRPGNRQMQPHDFAPYASLMDVWRFETGDFENVNLYVGDFIYADPPYDGTFDGYTAGGFSWADHERLAKLLAHHPGPVVLVNAATGRVLDLYHELGFETQVVDAPQRMHLLTGRTDRVREVIATNRFIDAHVTMIEVNP